MAAGTKSIEIFYSYARKDSILRDELEKHLGNLKRGGQITSWYDHEIIAGTEWEQQIDTHLNQAHIILLLVSPDFVNSDYCYGVEMKRAMERHKAGEARVIPVILRPVDLQGTPFSTLKVLPKNGKPVIRWANRDEAFLDVAQGIRRAIEELVGSNPPSSAYESSSPTTQSSPTSQVSASETRPIDISQPLPSVGTTPTPARQPSLSSQVSPGGTGPTTDSISWPPDTISIEIGQPLPSSQVSPNETGPITVGQPLTPADTRPSMGSQRLPTAQAVLSADPPTTRRVTRRDFLGDFLLVAVGGVIVGGVAGSLITWRVLPTSNRGPLPAPTPPAPKFPYIYRGHTGEVNTVAWSPNGKLIASGSRDNTVQVWSPFTGEFIRGAPYAGHINWVFAVAWSLDGSRIASASADQTVQVWDVATGNLIFTYKGHTGAVTAMAWSPDGKSIVSGSLDKTVQVWDASNGNPISTYPRHSSEVDAVAWARDSTRVASAGKDTTVQIWNANNASPVQTYTGHAAEVDAVAWSPDGTRIASGGKDKIVQVWDANTGGKNQKLIYPNHKDLIRSVAWSPNGKYIASASADRTVQVWDSITGTNISTYNGHQNWVHAARWSPDGKLIASGSADHSIQVWQVK